jgi:hypothetical protein
LTQNNSIMKTNFKILLGPIFLCISLFAQAQNATFEWQGGLCSYSGRFDSTKVSREVLQHTYDYLVWGEYLHKECTAWTLDGIKNLNLESVKQECLEKVQLLNTLSFVETPYFVQLKGDRIRETKESCEICCLSIEAYQNPEVLREFKQADSNCIFYREALIAGGQALIDAWTKLNEDMKRKNANPDRLQKEFDQKNASPQRMEYARLDVMNFGWWNSANNQIFHVEYDSSEAFSKLFTGVKEDCSD